MGDIDVPGDIGDIDVGEPWGLAPKIFLRISSGMSPGEPWGNLGGTLGAGQQDFLKDFFKDVRGTLGTSGTSGTSIWGNLGGLGTSTALRPSKNPFSLERLIGEKY